MLQEPALSLDTTCVPGELSARSDHSMARNNDAEGILPVDAAHRPCRTVPPNLRGERAVRLGCAHGNGSKRGPHLFLDGATQGRQETGPLERRHRLERVRVAREVALEAVAHRTGTLTLGEGEAGVAARKLQGSALDVVGEVSVDEGLVGRLVGRGVDQNERPDRSR